MFILGFNTASGRYYCNYEYHQYNFFVLLCVSIPQAVGTIAMNLSNQLDTLSKRPIVSIPQAVGTIAMKNFLKKNTLYLLLVSIPQAVGTIAI